MSSSTSRVPSAPCRRKLAERAPAAICRRGGGLISQRQRCASMWWTKIAPRTCGPMACAAPERPSDLAFQRHWVRPCRCHWRRRRRRISQTSWAGRRRACFRLFLAPLDASSAEGLTGMLPLRQALSRSAGDSAHPSQELRRVQWLPVPVASPEAQGRERRSPPPLAERGPARCIDLASLAERAQKDGGIAQRAHANRRAARTLAAACSAIPACAPGPLAAARR